MAFIPVPDTWEATFVYTQAGVRPAINTLYFFDGTGPFTPTRAAYLAGLLENWAIAEVLPRICVNVTLARIEVRDLTTQFGAFHSENVDDIGENSGARAPSNVTMSLSFRTGQVGRSFRGRNYLVGLSEDDFTNNVFDGAEALAWRIAYGTMQTTLAGEDFTHVVVSRYADGVARSEGITTPVTSYIFADLNVDTQRRRARSV